MGIHVKYTTICDSCGKSVVREFTPEKDYDESQSYPDIFSPGWPEDWVQCHEDDGCQLFCSHECVKADLVKRGKPEEAAEYDNIVWVA